MKSHRSFIVVFIVMAFAIGASVAQAQSEKKIKVKDLPAAVSAAFHKAYPNARILGASTEVEKGVTYYEVESKDGSVGRDLLYTQDGKVFETEETMSPSGLPAAVTATLSKELPKAKIVKTEKTTVESKVSYEIHLTLKGKKYSISIDPAGKVLEKKAANAKDESEKEEEDEGKESKKH